MSGRSHGETLGYRAAYMHQFHCLESEDSTEQPYANYYGGCQ